MRILNLGSLNIDYVYQVDHFVKPGETMSADSLQVNCGGKGLNQSVALSRAGMETYHAGLIGPEGGFLREKLREAGVHTDFIREIDGSTGHAIIQVNREGQNCILLHGGANVRLTESYIDEVLSGFGAADALLLQNETNLLGSILEKASAKGIPVALNAAPANEKLAELPLEKLSFLLVNEVEGAYLAGEKEPQRIADVLTARYPELTLILTLGVDGVIGAKGRERVFVPACKVKAVDTTAAGDTFTGFFLRCVLMGMSLEESLATATAASAIAVTRKGAADSVPSWEETIAFLQQSKQ